MSRKWNPYFLDGSRRHGLLGYLWESKGPIQVSEECDLVPSLGLEIEGCLSRQQKTVKLLGFPRQVTAWFPEWDTLQVTNWTGGDRLEPPPWWEGAGRSWAKGRGRGQGPLKAEPGLCGSAGPGGRARLGWHSPTSPIPCYDGPSVAGSRPPGGM